VGAGIYVAIGTVIVRAGDAAPFSFVIAGIAAGLTGLCYAELASRFPEAAGAASYVQRGFRSDRLALTGAAVTIAVAVAAASIAGGAVRYLVVLVPMSQFVLLVELIGGFTAIAVAYEELDALR
jgi:APA family basic amino acid/polyamine antiporter